jgi:hypothetical protein
MEILPPGSSPEHVVGLFGRTRIIFTALSANGGSLLSFFIAQNKGPLSAFSIDAYPRFSQVRAGSLTNRVFGVSSDVKTDSAAAAHGQTITSAIDLYVNANRSGGHAKVCQQMQN